MESKEVIKNKNIKITTCHYCEYFDHYNVECEKRHHPLPPYKTWFCAEGKPERGENEK